MNKGPDLLMAFDSGSESDDSAGGAHHGKTTTTMTVYQELMDSRDFLMTFQPKNINKEDDTSGTDEEPTIMDDLVTSTAKAGLIDKKRTSLVDGHN